MISVGGPPNQRGDLLKRIPRVCMSAMFSMFAEVQDEVMSMLL